MTKNEMKIENSKNEAYIYTEMVGCGKADLIPPDHRPPFLLMMGPPPFPRNFEFGGGGEPYGPRYVLR